MLHCYSLLDRSQIRSIGFDGLVNARESFLETGSRGRGVSVSMSMRVGVGVSLSMSHIDGIDIGICC